MAKVIQGQGHSCGAASDSGGPTDSRTRRQICHSAQAARHHRRVGQGSPTRPAGGRRDYTREGASPGCERTVDSASSTKTANKMTWRANVIRRTHWRLTLWVTSQPATGHSSLLTYLSTSTARPTIDRVNVCGPLSCWSY